jgi:hypothetical protein
MKSRNIFAKLFLLTATVTISTPSANIYAQEKEIYPVQAASRGAVFSLLSLLNSLRGTEAISDTADYFFSGDQPRPAQSALDRFFADPTYQQIIERLNPSEKIAFFAGQLAVTIPLFLTAYQLLKSNNIALNALGLLPAAGTLLASLPTMGGIKQLLLPPAQES